MKKAIIILFCAIIFLQSCANGREAMSSKQIKDNIIMQGYPKIDGSTSTLPVVQGIFKAFHEPEIIDGEEIWSGLPQSASQTIESYRMLINGELDLIIVPDPSEEVVKLAEEKCVELEYIPVCLEALAFITHIDAPLDNFTQDQIKALYVWDRDFWSEQSEEDREFVAELTFIFAPLLRNPDSGSHALMDKFVIKSGEIHPEINEDYIIYSMFQILDTVENYVNNNSTFGNWSSSLIPLGYTVYYFFQNNRDEQNWDNVKILSIDGVEPNNQTIASGEYPFSTNYYAVIRSSEPEDSASRAMVSWLLSEEGQEIFENAGFGKIGGGE
jgi:phosphate transport system substrate-binding protein